MNSLLLLLLIFVVLLVPNMIMQRKQRRTMQQLQDMHDALTIGDKVVTSAGVHASVHGIAEETLELEIAPGVITTWDKRAIIRNISAEETT